MTNQEAIKSLKNIIEYWTYKPTEVEAAKLAINALEKQVPKKPLEHLYDERHGDDDFSDYGNTYTCPNCSDDCDEVGRFSKEENEWIYQEEYCSKCGQKLDWF